MLFVATTACGGDDEPAGARDGGGRDAGGGALFVWARRRSADPWIARALVVLCPLLVSSTVAAALFTPPDVVSMLISLVLQWAAYVPVALLLLWIVSAVLQLPPAR